MWVRCQRAEKAELKYCILRWFRKLASEEQSRTFCGSGSKLQVVGAEMRKAHELSERLWRGTVSNLAEEECMVRGGL